VFTISITSNAANEVISRIDMGILFSIPKDQTREPSMSEILYCVGSSGGIPNYLHESIGKRFISAPKSSITFFARLSCMKTSIKIGFFFQFFITLYTFLPSCFILFQYLDNYVSFGNRYSYLKSSQNYFNMVFSSFVNFGMGLVFELFDILVFVRFG